MNGGVVARNISRGTFAGTGLKHLFKIQRGIPGPIRWDESIVTWAGLIMVRQRQQVMRLGRLMGRRRG